MTIMVIDGQGGKMGKGLVEQLKKLCPEDEILAVYYHDRHVFLGLLCLNDSIDSPRSIRSAF